MFLAAMLDLGVDARGARGRGCARWGSPGWGFEVSRAVRQAISGMHLDVAVSSEVPHVHRGLAEILGRIDASALPPRAKAQARAVFEVIGGRRRRSTTCRWSRSTSTRWARWTPSSTSAARRWRSSCSGSRRWSPLRLRSGAGWWRRCTGASRCRRRPRWRSSATCRCASRAQGELTTPTGAALLRALSRPGPPPPMRLVRSWATGSATASFPDRPNVLRATLGTRGRGARRRTCGSWRSRSTTPRPQLLGYLVETLLAHGALGRLGRPGHPEEEPARSRALGPRRRRRAGAGGAAAPLRVPHAGSTGLAGPANCARPCTRGGRDCRTDPVRVKVGSLDGEILNAAPEYEDVRARAESTGVPFKQVWAEALAAYARGR